MVLAAVVFGRAGLAGDLDGEIGEDISRRPFFRNIAHAFADQIEGRPGNGQGADLLRRKNLVRRAVEVVDAADQKGTVLDAAVGHFADDQGRLEWRDELEALADSRVERIAQIPVFAKGIHLVFFAGNEARRLAAQVDARLLAHAEHGRVFRQLVDADAAAHFIEIYVVRLGQGFGKVNPAQGFAAGIAHVYEPVAAAVEDQFVRRNLFQFQGGGAGNNLKGRARRIFAGNGPVFHGVIGIVVDLRPFGFRNPPGKPVRIIRRAAGHSQHGSRIGV